MNLPSAGIFAVRAKQRGDLLFFAILAILRG
jgi:hypothetical protein